ncbi:MAG: type II secretion system F family protein [Sedimentisphaerales bacterium]|nr:type II secretion system F family protein [Sedimentisphaerales bacterium]
MPRYQYIAIEGNGKKVKGSITAESSYAARKQLRVRNIHPSSIVESGSDKNDKSGFFPKLTRRSKNQVIEFTKQMATLLNSGIKLTDSLSVLSMQISDTKLKNAIIDIRDRVVTGESFTDAIKDYSDFFDVIYVSMVRVGDMTGSLGESLTTIAGFMEKRQKVESKIITAMIYPLVLVIFCVFVILFMTIKVIPTIAEQIQQAGQQLPWLTQRLMDFKNIMVSWKIIIVIGVIAGIVTVLWQFLKTERGAYMRDKFILSLPLFGPLIKQRVVARFASTLSTLIGSGLAMAESLRVVAEVTGNSIMKKAIHKARERILAGADIATPLRDSGVIDPAIAHMVAVGEKSGELEKMLKNISDNLEASTDVVIERLSATIEPVIIIIMAGIVGVIAYATISPILEVTQGQF